jgi:hypothetical protein
MAEYLLTAQIVCDQCYRVIPFLLGVFLEAIIDRQSLTQQFFASFLCCLPTCMADAAFEKRMEVP